MPALMEATTQGFVPVFLDGAAADRASHKGAQRRVGGEVAQGELISIWRLASAGGAFASSSFSW